MVEARETGHRNFTFSSDCESQSGLQSASMNLQTSEHKIIEKEQSAVIGLLDKDLNRPE